MTTAQSQSVAPAPRRTAFTLIELTIAVLVMGILAAVAAPAIVDAMRDARARAAALVVASDLDHARHQAQARNDAQTVTFDPSAETYELVGLSHFDRASQSYVVDLAPEPYQAALDSASFGADGTSLSITFNRFGRPDYGGSVVVSAGGVQRTVVVDGVTGKATVQP